MKKFGTITGVILWLFTFILSISFIGPIALLIIPTDLGNKINQLAGFSGLTSTLTISIILFLLPLIWYFIYLKRKARPSNLIFVIVCLMAIIFMNTSIALLFEIWETENTQKDLETRIVSVTLWTSWTYVIFGIIHDITNSKNET